MAAQAVDFTISGQVSRTLFITDSDTPNSTKAKIADGNTGSTRVRANGSSGLEDGSTVGIQFEYAMDATASLRHANVQYTNPVAGRITIGQGSEAGDGSAGLGPGVAGIGAGQAGTSETMYLDAMGKKMTLGGAFFGSLDGGGRTNMIRYDTPSIGPMSAAVSVGNDDSFSGLLAVSSEFSGSTFGAKVGTHHMPRPDAPSMRDPSTVSASVGLTLANGLSVGGAWGKGEDQLGMPAVRARVKYVGGFADLAAFRNAITTNDATFTATTEIADLTDAQKATYRKFVDDNLCNVKTLEAAGMDGANRDNLGNVCIQVPYSDAMPETSVDPSYFRMGIGYTFGGTTVAASWYNSEDFVMTGSDGTAYGIGASHELPKVGATFHASVQNYKVEMPGTMDMKETVIQIGTVVEF